MNIFLFFCEQVVDNSSDLDRSVSARSSRTSELSNSTSASCNSAQAGETTVPAASPIYLESLWSQVKYEVDCEQNVADCSMEGMRANIVKEILKNERDFVDNLKDVIEGKTQRFPVKFFPSVFFNGTKKLEIYLIYSIF